MPRRVDPRYYNNVIDTNILDRLEDGHDEAVDAMLALYRGNMVSFQLPYSVKAEIDHPHTPTEVKERAREFIFTEPVTLTANEHALHAEVRELIRGNAAPGQHDQDAFHLFEAEKYGGGYFVTRDRRLLRKRAEIERLLGLIVLAPTEFMSVYQEFEADERRPRP